MTLCSLFSRGLDAAQKLDRPRKKSICPLPLREEACQRNMCPHLNPFPEGDEAKPEMRQAPAFLFP